MRYHQPHITHYINPLYYLTLADPFCDHILHFYGSVSYYSMAMSGLTYIEKMYTNYHMINHCFCSLVFLSPFILSHFSIRWGLVSTSRLFIFSLLVSFMAFTLTSLILLITIVIQTHYDILLIWFIPINLIISF